MKHFVYCTFFKFAKKEAMYRVLVYSSAFDKQNFYSFSRDNLTFKISLLKRLRMLLYGSSVRMLL